MLWVIESMGTLHHDVAEFTCLGESSTHSHFVGCGQHFVLVRHWLRLMNILLFSLLSKKEAVE